MVTVIYSLNKMQGAEIMLLGWLACAAVYMAICLLYRENRTGQGGRNVIWYLIAAEIMTDIIWALLYYEKGVYINYGVASVYGALIWPVALITAGVFVTLQNKDEQIVVECVGRDRKGK